MGRPAYDTLGLGYRQVRRPEPRIATRIETALGAAESVLNVGAGAGSYEPRGRAVTAVEPSPVMIAQRPPGAAPVLQASAESLPFDDNAFDAAMALIAVHHWSDLETGLAEMRRVAPRTVVLTFDPRVARSTWLAEYFAPLIEHHLVKIGPIDRTRRALPGARTEVVPVPSGCRDGFFLALWDRPEMHLDPDVRRGSSVWHEVPPTASERCLERLASDLGDGTWDERHGALRTAPELDVGLRLLVAG